MICRRWLTLSYVGLPPTLCVEVKEYLGTWAETWHRVWGMDKISLGPNFRFPNDFLLGKKCPFTTQKFLMTFFRHRLISLYFRCRITGDPVSCFSSPKLLIPTPKFLLMTFFLLSAYFASHPITVILKILGKTDAWAVPHLKVWGTVPLSPRRCV